MDLIGENPIIGLADQDFRIYSKNTARPPQYIGKDAVVDNSLISEGCRIYGTVINSVVSGGVVVEAGAVVKDSVIMEDVVVKKDAKVFTAIVDSDTVVEEGATVGIEIDRLIARYSKIQPSRSVMLQAIGTERVEALCDVFCTELSAEREESKLHSRFSPGYGDLPLDIQREIFRALECGKRIGVTLGENLFMTPTKSVTAIIGVEKVK